MTQNTVPQKQPSKSKYMYICNTKVNLRKNTPRSVFASAFGLGYKSATKLSHFFLLHPSSKKFKTPLKELLGSHGIVNIFSNVLTDYKLRFKLFNDLRKHAEVFSYKTLRFFQYLPSKGQRTHTNAGTSKRNLNPFEKLRINTNYVESLKESFMKIELINNKRNDELRAFVLAKDLERKAKKATARKKLSVKQLKAMHLHKKFKSKDKKNIKSKRK